MQLAKYRSGPDKPPRVGLVDGAGIVPLVGNARLSDILHAHDPLEEAMRRIDPTAIPLERSSITLLAPLDEQEVWGAGVTYERSKVARQEESESGGSFYDQVYSADRPELFFKATPSRVVGAGQPIRIRRDSAWTVPEPELALVLSPQLRLAGLTIGNDVSARDIEGRNPLYLPQAKVYEACCALGPVVTLCEEGVSQTVREIRLRITRDGQVVYDEATSTRRMARTFRELIDWLGRDNVFPSGAILLTGTGLVPPDDFSLHHGDEVSIEVEGIGVLTNPVIQAKGKK